MKNDFDLPPAHIVEGIVLCIKREQERATIEQTKAQVLKLYAMAQQSEDWQKMSDKERAAIEATVYAFYNMKKELELYIAP